MPAADSADTAASRPGFVSRLRGLLADALELAHVRLELLADRKSTRLNSSHW